MKRFAKIAINTCFIILGIAFILLVLLYFMGYKPYIVKSGSMEPSIETGSLAILDTDYEYSNLNVGDIIAYRSVMDSISGAYDVSVTHRVVSIDDDLIETKGDNNDVSDGFCVSKNNYIGLTMFAIPKLGYVFSWMQTKRGLVICTTILMLLILADILLTSEKEEEI